VIVDAAARRAGYAVRSSDLLVRTASAAVLLAIALGAAYLGGLVAGAAAGAFSFLVLLEWGTITGRTLRRTLPFAAAVAVAVAVTGLGMLATACAIALVATVAAAIHTRDLWLPGGVMYASVFGIGPVALRLAPEFGLAALIFLLAVVWATDSAAFFAGRTIGGPKLAPKISPEKTWAGAIGGLMAALAGGVAAAWVSGIPATFGLISVAFALSVFSQLGDLFESWLKRRFGAKDSGNIIPGHGGVMDRVDGLTFAGVAAVAIGAAHGGSDGLGRGLLIW
jgi:phosphatidate cytidylyltransferase